MLVAAYAINSLGMILLPVLASIYFSRRFKLSWKLLVAGGLTFLASQIPHVPLTIILTPLFQSWGPIAYAIVLGLLAGIFEETARYALFRVFLRKSRTWNEGIFVGLGHGGAEAVILGILSALAFVNMIIYKNVDLSTVQSIPASQLELAKQQVAAYWAAPAYMALLGMVERSFAICLHVSLSVMVLYSIANNKAIWFWGALLWHAFVDALAVFLGQLHVNVLALEGAIAILALIGLWIAFGLRPKFPGMLTDPSNAATVDA
jgi:uncharacterized membrane protein YhfC